MLKLNDGVYTCICTSLHDTLLLTFLISIYVKYCLFPNVKFVVFFCLLCGAGYEVSGMENIPVDTPALIVLYHGAVPIDIYYLIAKTILYKNRLIHTVGDRFLFKIPGKYSDFNIMNLV